MVQVPMKTAKPLNKQNILSIHQKRIRRPCTAQNIQSVYAGGQSGAKAAERTDRLTTSAAARPQPSTAAPKPAAPASIPAQMPVPALTRPVQKGEKVSLESCGALSSVRACLGWNVTNNSCDVDVSAFLLNEKGRVPGDGWFVFYGQKKSPDGSVVFSADSVTDRETITIDFHKLSNNVRRIVFVLTIHEALEKHLNFSMLKDAYIRILNPSSHQELAGFQMDEYYSNVTSMMIGEIYKHKDIWKFNAIGNGVAKDLAGLCALYGVQVI